MPAKLIIDDFIMLGRTFPQQTKNHGITVCACGYSPELRQLIRIYPLKMTDSIPKWSICRLTLERPRTDTRRESWKLSEPFKTNDIVGKIKKDDGFELLKKLSISSIDALNKSKSSLGVIVPQSIAFSLKSAKEGDDLDSDYCQQLNLFAGKETIYKPSVIPYLHVTQKDGKVNNLQLRDWGIAEFLRKGNKKDEIVSAIKLDDSNYEHLLIVGNMKTFKNVWLTIGTVFKKVPVTNQQISYQPSLLFC